MEQANDENYASYSERLGIADHVTSLEHFERKGIQCSPWVWFGSLTTNAAKISIDRYPDLIETGITIRWVCPLCHEEKYVTREDLMEHLNSCVKYSVWNKHIMHHTHVPPLTLA